MKSNRSLFSSFTFAVMMFVSVNAADLSPEVTKSLDAFNKTKDSKSLQNAYAELQRVPAKDARDAAERRMKFLEAVAASYDPAYDTNPPPKPKLSADPPPGYDSSVSPESVTNPVERKAYEKRIAENTANAQAHSIQIAIRRVISDAAREIAQQPASEGGISDDDIRRFQLPEHLRKALEKELKSQRERQGK